MSTSYRNGFQNSEKNVYLFYEAEFHFLVRFCLFGQVYPEFEGFPIFTATRFGREKSYNLMYVAYSLPVVRHITFVCMSLMIL